MIRPHSIFRLIPPEAFFWAGGLLLLAILDPDAPGHVSVCPFKNLGLSFCPGCGLGHSITLLFHGRLPASISAHPLGIPAVAILAAHVVRIIRRQRFILAHVNP